MRRDEIIALLSNLNSRYQGTRYARNSRIVSIKEIILIPRETQQSLSFIQQYENNPHADWRGFDSIKDSELNNLVKVVVYVEPLSKKISFEEFEHFLKGTRFNGV